MLESMKRKVKFNEPAKMFEL